MKLRPGIKPLRAVTDPAPDMSRAGTEKYISEMSAAAQRAELAGDSLRAEAAHQELNDELGNLR